MSCGVGRMERNRGRCSRHRNIIIIYSLWVSWLVCMYAFGKPRPTPMCFWCDMCIFVYVCVRPNLVWLVCEICVWTLSYIIIVFPKFGTPLAVALKGSVHRRVNIVIVDCANMFLGVQERGHALCGGRCWCCCCFMSQIVGGYVLAMCECVNVFDGLGRLCFKYLVVSVYFCPSVWLTLWGCLWTAYGSKETYILRLI